MGHENFDAINHRLLDLLTQDGRTSYQAMADEVGLSRPAVMERIKRLEEAGVIRGYTAVLDRARIGRPVTAFISVRFPTSTVLGVEPEIQTLLSNPDVLECHHVAGEDCYMLKVAAPSLERLEKVLRTIKGGENASTTRTTIVLSTVFEKAVLPPPLAGDD